jgi:hypothetical protein
MTTLDALKAVRSLLSDPHHWTTHTVARDADGRATSSTSETACRWCLMGAVGKVVGKKYGELFGPVMNELDRHSGRTAIFVNDIEGHEAVLRLLDRAIRGLEGK